MRLQFTPGWSMDGMTYAYSYRFPQTPVFRQKEDCVENGRDEGSAQDYDNITLVTKDRLGSGTTLTARCAFENPGAPLIILTPQLDTDERGAKRYGDYVEVVLYSGGINVWKLWNSDGTVRWKKLLGAEFPVTEGEIHTLSVTVRGETLHIQADDRKFSLLAEGLYPAFHAGITACEGINRFYELDIREDRP